MKAVIKTWLNRCARAMRLAVGYLSLMALQPAVALTMDATRYVFTGDKDALSVTVANEAGQTYGGQGWVENIVEQDTRPSFVVTPSFFKVGAGDKQVLRVIKAVELPQDKESVYWLNLQEIPPAAEGSGLRVAVRTRVKLFYRPASLMGVRKDAEKQLALQPGGDGLVLKNTTPHVFVITSLLDNADKSLPVKPEAMAKLNLLKPGDEVVVPRTTSKIRSLDDLGEVHIYPLGQETGSTGTVPARATGTQG